jgi:hypothetical protein
MSIVAAVGIGAEASAPWLDNNRFLKNFRAKTRFSNGIIEKRERCAFSHTSAGRTPESGQLAEFRRLRGHIRGGNIPMIDHTGIGVSDMGGAARFYDAVLETLGLRRVMVMAGGADGIGYGVDYPVFWIDRFHPHSTRQHTAFAAVSRAQVDAFHAAALTAGGRG